MILWYYITVTEQWRKNDKHLNAAIPAKTWNRQTAIQCLSADMRTDEAISTQHKQLQQNCKLDNAPKKNRQITPFFLVVL